MDKLRSLWLGDLPLRDAFWGWAVRGGLTVNVTTTLLFLWLVSRDQPWLALALGYGCSVPYNIVAVIGVWRSAARHDGLPLHADLARGTVIALMAVLSVL
ncbi:hypothetical protein SAMN04488003_11141 [Loktanella fryxellensis]|uniref:Uncharacterized protein n=1 Tax=Loktanella fryxellensis TaxID=245187 RepID=A0A1H8EN26_9RHOB|nr:hypothetical protein [Loktanella fryxellensis]SEN20991.1 hypothetical protein SAMN04488003_11141 [Loktanella fryxellensis]